MMGSDFYFRDKIPVAILGATGRMGQTLVQLLASHPWFQIVALCDLEPFIGQLYQEVISKPYSSSLPETIAQMSIIPCEPIIACSLIFSGLDPGMAISEEIRFAEAGYHVVSYAPYRGISPFIPQIVVKVNFNHLLLMEKQPFLKGKIITTPSSPLIELALILKPLLDQFGIEEIQVTAPPLFSQSKNLEGDLLHILGDLQEETIQDAHFKIKIQIANLEKSHFCISVNFTEKPKEERIIQVWHSFLHDSELFTLPFISFQNLSYFNQIKEAYTQQDSLTTIPLADLHPASLFDYQFTLLEIHSIQRVAISMLLNAELLVIKGQIHW